MFNPLPSLDLCQAAYNAVQNGGLDIDIGAGRAIFEDLADAFHVACPGTILREEHYTTLKADLDCPAVYVDRLGVRAHEGFAKAALGMVPILVPKLRASGRPIIFDGHSLGAALAIDLAAYCVSLGIPVKAVIGFAPPRCVDGIAIGRRFHDAGVMMQLYRHAGDVIPDLPPCEGLSHPGALQVIGHFELDPIKAHMLDTYDVALSAPSD